MPDKRAFRRFSLENNIFLKFENDPAKIIDCKLLDISFGGASIFLKENINLDTMLQCIAQFDYPVSVERNLIGKCRVVSVKKHRLYAQDGFRIGVEFVEVDKDILIETITRIEAIVLDQIRKKRQIS
ncbi:MAG: PilZ domain-containing protein [Candidatus Omnitrophica bacterium]|nr:PilZ domain-containing protein [Candidatus Omnitrophota bacterium]